MTAKELAARLSLPESLQQQVFSIPILPAQEQEWNELFLRDQEAFELRLHRHPTPELWHFICAGPLRPIAAISPLGFQKLSFGIHFKILRSGAKSACVSLANQD